MGDAGRPQQGSWGVVRPSAGRTHVLPDERYLASYFADVRSGATEAKDAAALGDPHSGSRDDAVKGRTGSTEGGGQAR